MSIPGTETWPCGVGKTDGLPAGMLPVGSAVRIHRVDAYGLMGREPHPPVAPGPGGGSSPCNGQLALVVAYVGWENPEGFFCAWQHDDGWLTHDQDTSRGNTEWTPEQVYERGEAMKLIAEHAEETTHHYLLVVHGLGVWSFADYELEEGHIP
jgi:hypothetical protein